MKKYTIETLPAHWSIRVDAKSGDGCADYYQATLRAVLSHPVVQSTCTVDVSRHRGFKTHTAERRALDHAWELDHPAYAKPGPKQTELEAI